MLSSLVYPPQPGGAFRGNNFVESLMVGPFTIRGSPAGRCRWVAFLFDPGPLWILTRRKAIPCALSLREALPGPPQPGGAFVVHIPAYLIHKPSCR